MNVDYKLIGARIRDGRKNKGYTQEILAEKLNVTVGYVSQIERGITKISLDLLATIATILECDLATLVTGAAMQMGNYKADQFLEGYSSLTTKEKQLVIGFINLLKENQN